MICSLEYIPPRLHTNDRNIIDRFQVGEQLYYRCKGLSCTKPYDNISLYDISHNRNFSDPEKYPTSDVLFNIIEDNDFQQYDMDTVPLIIRELKEEITFSKEFVSHSNPDIRASLTLKHKPVPCMYTHAVMEIILNDVIVTKENYKSTIGRSGAIYKNLRRDIRQELSSILQTKNLDLNEDIEILDEP